MRARSKFHCKLCSYTAPFPSALEIHVRQHLGEKPFHCLHCSYSFASKSALSQHIVAKHETEQPFPCSYSGCEKRFKTKTRLKAHAEGVDERLTPFMCTECPMQFYKKTGLKDHFVRRHTQNNKVFECDKCGHKSSTASDLKRHTENRHIPYLHLQCDTCGSEHKNKTCLARHVRSHHRIQSKPKTLYKCKEPNCLKEYTSSGAFHYHKVKEHGGGVKPFPCSICSYSAIDANSLTIHTRVHTGERPYKCDLCNGCFTTSGHLRSHKAGVHSERRPFKCKCCPYRAKTHSALRIHGRTHYPDAFKQFKCDICHYKCNTRHALQQHQMRHQDEKPFQCEQCNYKEKTRKNLRDHEFIHNSKKPYKCLQCSYSCRHRWVLSKHMLNHQDAVPFVCLAVNCQGKYKTKQSLKSHLERVHNILDKFKCIFCPEVFYQEKEFQRHTQDHILKEPRRKTVVSQDAPSNLSIESTLPPCYVLVKRLKIIS